MKVNHGNGDGTENAYMDDGVDSDDVNGSN
jgi:hypothetical protein